MTRAKEVVEKITGRAEHLNSDVLAVLVVMFAEAVANAEAEIQKLRAELTGRESPVELLK